MFSREFEYTGYDGKPKKDTYWFNLTEAELYEIDLSSIHGFTGEMNKLLKEERTKEIVEACDFRVKIPMGNGVDSLNVAAASAVIFWELRR